MIAEIIFVFYIIYFIFCELVAMKKMKKKYWKSYWTLAEWAVIGLAFIAGGLYVYR